MKRYAFVNILEYWNLECYVMGSLLIQIILVVIGPMRRWSNNGLMHMVIWLVYLMANFFSTFALSLIYYHDAAKDKKEYAVYPLWAPFLLVHLGGPHTITALSVEDNNLWHRHVLALMVQGCSVLVVLYQYRILDSEWLLPTAIVFLVGIVKCFERIFSLQFASSDFVRGSILRRAAAAAGDVGNKTTSPPSEDEELEIVRRGYKLYQTFKGFIIDHTFIINNSKDDDECGTDMKWFRSLDVKKAFKVMEMELYFMYEAMFTKMIAVEYWKNNYFWCIWRFVCHALLITVTVIFFCHSKHHLHPSVIGITYCLLGCALLLDQIALLNLIFSHWTIVKIMNSKWYNKATASEKWKVEVVRNIILPLINCGQKLLVRKLWSENIIQYSLVSHSLRARWKWAELKPEFYSLREDMDSWLHTKTAEVDHSLKELVFEYIKRKANSQQQPPTLPQQQEEEEEQQQQQQQQKQKEEEEHLHHVDMNDYATCVLILHVATEICYFTAPQREGDGEKDAELGKTEGDDEEKDAKLGQREGDDEEKDAELGQREGDDEEKDAELGQREGDDEEKDAKLGQREGDEEKDAKLGQREGDAELCIKISQYLAYLLVLEGNITSTLPGSIGMRFKDICSEQVHHTFDHLYSAFNEPDKGRWCRKRMRRKQACQMMRNCADPCLFMKHSSRNDEQSKPKGLARTISRQMRNCVDPCLFMKHSSRNDEQSKGNNQKGNSTKPKGLARAISRQMRNCVDPCLFMELDSSNESVNHKKMKKSVLPKAIKLAQAMKQQQQQQQGEFWKGLSEVWVGLLVYASTHCRGDVYYLNRGGQFYTFVRLLMAHFGLQQSLKFERPFQFHNEICTNLSEPSFQLHIHNEICTKSKTQTQTSKKK